MKNSITTIVVAIIACLAGAAGMYQFGASKAGQQKTGELESAIGTLSQERDAARDENTRLKADLDRLKNKSGSEKIAATEIAAETDRLAREKGEANERADRAEAALHKLKQAGAETELQLKAELEGKDKKSADYAAILEKYGIFEHLTPEEIKARIDENDGLFKRAFELKDKEGVIKAIAALQKLGPLAYDKTIEMWMKVAEDYGTGMNWGKGKRELGLSDPDMYTLISNWDLIKYSITNESTPSTFRISSIYGLPYRASVPAEERAKIAGEALGAAKGYDAFAAITALNEIEDKSTVGYLVKYVETYSENTMARENAISALGAKNTPEAWATIEKIAANDPDEKVKAAAQAQLIKKTAKGPGVLITNVFPNSQAALAGVKVGDVLVSYNGKEIRSMGDITEAKKTVADGQTAEMIVKRGEERVTLTIGSGTIGINGTDLK
ncbi:MAG: HEAT repeat domain-containing protein [Planctomycetes bacterium]|nr:HEAT repeat domain-containing protein [Planctomycetota bacterium]